MGKRGRGDKFRANIEAVATMHVIEPIEPFLSADINIIHISTPPARIRGRGWRGEDVKGEADREAGA